MNSDTSVAISTVMYFVAGLFVIAAALRLFGVRISSVCSKEEWFACWKILLGGLLYVLIVVQLTYNNLPQELFIYGRF